MTPSALGMFAALGAVAAWTDSVPPADNDIVARVGGQPILGREVTRLVATVTKGKEVPRAGVRVVKAQVLEELIARRLVLAYARRTGSSPTSAEADAALAEFKAKLSLQRRSLADYYKTQGITEEDLRRQLAWNRVWEKYLAKYLTQEREEAYFRAHRRDLDGTEIRVSHILLRAPPGGPSALREDLTKRAQAIRQEILSGKASFAEAARKYSGGPSAQEDGKMGFIPRHGVMDEAFSRAAFALEPGQVSEPVETPFGVHLIRCDEIKPGTKILSQVRKQVEEVLGRELLSKLADLERRYSPIEYTGRSPHFRPGTREVVEP